jgi:hypothetical protein
MKMKIVGSIFFNYNTDLEIQDVEDYSVMVQILEWVKERKVED